MSIFEVNQAVKSEINTLTCEIKSVSHYDFDCIMLDNKQGQIVVPIVPRSRTSPGRRDQPDYSGKWSHHYLQVSTLT